MLKEMVGWSGWRWLRGGSVGREKQNIQEVDTNRQRQAEEGHDQGSYSPHGGGIGGEPRAGTDH